MTQNENTTDRIISIIIALAALAGSIMIGITTIVGVILLIVAVVMVATAAVGFCPLYRLFGISTCKVSSTTESSKQPVKTTV